MDMTLATLLGSKPSFRQRPDFAALYDWFVDSSPSDAEAAVFVNVPEHLVERLTGWVIWLNQTGFRVFAKPKVGNSDIDDELAGYAFAHGADEVFLASPHGWSAGRLPAHHRDPFDRVLVAQARHEQLLLVTDDDVLARYGVPILGH